MVALFVLLTFVPILSVHPFRVAWPCEPSTWGLTSLWCLAAIAAVANPFPSPLWVQVLLVATAAYFVGVSLHRSLRPGHD